MRQIRVAFHTDNGIAAPTREVVDCVKVAARSLADAGCFVEEARPSGVERTFDLVARLFGADGGAGVQVLLEMAGTTEPSPLLMQLGATTP